AAGTGVHDRPVTTDFALHNRSRRDYRAHFFQPTRARGRCATAERRFGARRYIESALLAVLRAEEHAERCAVEAEALADRVRDVAAVAEVHGVRVVRARDEDRRARAGLRDVVEAHGLATVHGRRVVREHVLEEAVELAGRDALL